MGDPAQHSDLRGTTETYTKLSNLLRTWLRSFIWKSIGVNHEMFDFPLFTENPVSLAEGLMKSEEIAFQEKMK